MWKLKPNYDDELIRINSTGFRDKERRCAKDKGLFRILCLGDSSTFGVRVLLSETYHSQLEEALNERSGSAGRKFEVMNAGVDGYTSAQGLAFYKYKGTRYHPDMVTFYFGINDPIKRFYLDDDKIMRFGTLVFIKSIENGYLLNLSSYRLFRKIVLFLFKDTNRENRQNIPRVSQDSFKRNIIELSNLCRRSNTLLVLISPAL
jgi:lysophospholipase L1-like esterase